AATKVTDPTNGTLTLNTDGSLSYVPNANFNGTDTFTYSVADADGDTDTATVTITVNSINDTPNAVDDTYVVDEDTTLTVAATGVLGNDSLGGDGGTLSATKLSDPSNGTVTLNGDGSLSYTPTADFNGSDSFTYSIADADGSTDTATVTITVNSVNDTPDAVDDTYVVDEDTILTVAAGSGVLGNDSLGGDGGTLVATKLSDPSNGTVSLSSDGSMTYTPTGDFNGSDSYTYSIADADGSTDTATVTITVNAVNDAPEAVDDSYFVNEDATLTVAAAAGVLTNDSIGGDGGTLAVTGNSSPSNGTLSLISDGSLEYTPTSNFNGVDSFTYTIRDVDGSTATATVTITVDGQNDSPIANDDAYSGDEDTAITVAAGSGVLSNDEIGGDGGTLEVTGNTSPSDGALSLSSDGSLTYTPNANFNGEDTFTYTITDADGSSDSATVTLTVNSIDDLPVATDDAYAVDEDSVLSVDAGSGVLINDDISGDGGALAVSGNTAPSSGSLSQSGDGSLTYTPNANFVGTDTYTYTIEDADGSVATATVTITVNSVDDLPNAVDDAYVVDEDTTLTVDVGSGVLTNDDIGGDGGTLAVTGNTSTSNGSLSVNADGSLTYTPNLNFVGSDSFTYTIEDADGSVATATVTITVNSVDDLPIAVDDTYSVDEDTTLTVDAGSGVLSNDDIGGDGGTLAVTSNTNTSEGALSLNSDGGLTYTPNANFHGTDTFSYTIEDIDGTVATANVTIIVKSVNDLPVAVDDAYVVDEDTTLVVDAANGVLINDDIGGDGGVLEVTGNTSPSNGTLNLSNDGSLSYTPAANFNGTDSFTYTIEDADGSTATATVTISINSVDDLPIAVDDDYSVSEGTVLTVDLNNGVLSNDSIGGDGGNLVVGSSTKPSNGTISLSSDGSFIYTPNAAFFGTDSLTYTISDADGSLATATVTIQVNELGDGPSAIDDSYTADEDSILTVAAASGVLGNDNIGRNGGTLSVSSNTNPNNGSLILNSDGGLSYTPNPSFNGVDTFEYTITDATGLTDTATVTITIAPVNDVPIAVDDSYIVDEDQVLTVALGNGVLVNDSIGGDGGNLVVSSNTNPTNGSLNLSADGSLTYTPNPNFNGADSFTYTIADADGSEAIATVSITVNPVDDLPVAVDDAYSVDEDVTLTVDAANGVLTNDSIGGDGGVLSVNSNTNPSNGTLSLSGNGSLAYTPNFNFSGTDVFTYTIEDADGSSATATVTITVNPLPDGPGAVDDEYFVNQGATLTVALGSGVLQNDLLGGDGGALVVTGNTNPANGSVTLNADGSLSYTPNAGFNGSDTFDYTIDNGSGLTDTARVTITVEGSGDSPVAVDDAYIVDEDAVLTVGVANGILANDSIGADGGTLAVVSSTDTSAGTLALNNDGSLSYTPNPNFFGSDSFTYEISDVDGSRASATVTITVNSVDDVPVAVDDAYSVDEDGFLVVDITNGILTNDSIGGDGGNLSVSSNTSPGNGTLNLSVDGSLDYTPNPNFAGVDQFEYTIADVDGSTATATVVITVNEVDDLPVALGDAYTVNEDTVLTVDAVGGVLSND
ncbi:Ig-like domain-containing protein, partial [Verrucomicrobia bacterium]|nr:Ig-like domain-containing protein [Verrucomicrobiota bacterium]